MYQVFLVDDDALILEELINIVPWPDNGFEVAGYETNPFCAVEKIRELRPDAVFCDLRMLGMDGNELIKLLRDEGIPSEFVMISAYDEFENVRTFYRQAGFDYILKPVQLEDIEMVLERLNRRLSDSRPREESELLTDNPGFNKLVLYVNEHFTEKLTLNQLAEEFGYSRNYICGLFQKFFNKSLNSYLTELRMKHAMELLSDKTILIKEVAKESGYSDYYRFFKVFKNHFGYSPKELREQQR